MSVPNPIDPFKFTAEYPACLVSRTPDCGKMRHSVSYKPPDGSTCQGYPPESTSQRHQTLLPKPPSNPLSNFRHLRETPKEYPYTLLLCGENSVCFFPPKASFPVFSIFPLSTQLNSPVYSLELLILEEGIARVMPGEPSRPAKCHAKQVFPRTVDLVGVALRVRVRGNAFRIRVRAWGRATLESAMIKTKLGVILEHR